jgi:hypothetical protein
MDRWCTGVGGGRAAQRRRDGVVIVAVIDGAESSVAVAANAVIAFAGASLGGDVIS